MWNASRLWLGALLLVLPACGNSNGGVPRGATEPPEGEAGLAGAPMAGKGGIGGGGPTGGSQAGGAASAGGAAGGAAGAEGGTGTGGAGTSGVGGGGGVSGLEACSEGEEGQLQTRTRYAVASAKSSLECVPEVQARACRDGQWTPWSGSLTFEHCAVDGCPALLETRVRYEVPAVEYPSVCIPEWQFRTCQDGVTSPWSGKFMSEECVVNVKDCGATPHLGTEKRTRYRAQHVPFGEVCESQEQSRLCINGELGAWTGFFVEEHCEVTPPANCDDTTHGTTEKRVRYRNALVNGPWECEQETQTRTCNDGVWSNWSGSAEIAQLSCRVVAGGSCEEAAQCSDGVCVEHTCGCGLHERIGTCDSESCCVCSSQWAGEACGTCPGNFDVARDCGACRNHWTQDDCSRCPGQFTIASDCKTCSPGWSGPNCDVQNVCVRYVDADSKAKHQTGYAWNEAFSTIRKALQSVELRDDCQIWVREGTYLDGLDYAHPLAIYGGFAGTEQSLSERSPGVHPVVLGQIIGMGPLDGVTLTQRTVGDFTVRSSKMIGKDATLAAAHQLLVEDSLFDGVSVAIEAEYGDEVVLRRVRVANSFNDSGLRVMNVAAGASVKVEDSVLVDNFSKMPLFSLGGEPRDRK